ncbi:MAG TPA: hypothetical protein DCX60_05100 [Phycisphaerales bacterium]|nr:hypothetical protein [Phycisphaerales bacterium]|tara:strand:+ start:480 stop:773 length:294 start_codon:yes stop_codon:yes gene_type:complete
MQENQNPENHLSTHRNRNFVGQTMHLAGHAFIDCTFDGCTLVLTNGPVFTKNVRFHRCNFRLEYDILWSDAKSRSQLRQLLDLIDGAPDAGGRIGDL